jgi:AcrR family transcriptional regulator
MEATVKMIEARGYAGATLELIAEAAGVTRGSILHHFSTRAQLMTEVVQWIYDTEIEEYTKLLEAQPGRGSHFSDWPEIVWEVLRQPRSVAALEILQARRNDPELAANLDPVQARIERNSFNRVRHLIGGDHANFNEIGHLIVGAARGLSVSETNLDQAERRASMRMLGRLIEAMDHLPQTETR